MRRFRCETAAVFLFSTGFGLMLGLLISSGVFSGILGITLMLVGILLAFKK